MATAVGTEARIWKTETGQPVTPPIVLTGVISNVAFSPDGFKVATNVRTFAGKKIAQVWDSQTGQPVTAPAGFLKWFNPFSQCCKMGSRYNSAWSLLILIDNDTVKVFDQTASNLMLPPMVHKTPVRSAEFDPDGRKVITAWKNNAQLWDTESGKAVSIPIEHQDNVQYAAFDPKGNQIITALDNDTARVWERVRIPDVGDAFPDFIEQISGYRLDAIGNLQSLPEKNQAELRAWLAKAKDLSPESRHFINWLLSDPLEKTVTPNGKQTVKERVQQLIDIDTVPSLNEALDYWPGHPFALAKLAAATLRDSKPEQREMTIPRARLWANLALRYAPNDTAVRTRAEQVLREINHPKTSIRKAQ